MYGKILRKLRLNAGYKATEVARMLVDIGYNVKNTSISHWENDRSNPPLDVFVSLCALYGMPETFETFENRTLIVKKPALNYAGYRKLMEYRDLLLHNEEYAIRDKPLDEPADKQEIPVHVSEMMRQASDMRRKEMNKRESGSGESAEKPGNENDVQRELRVYTLGPQCSRESVFPNDKHEVMRVPRGKANAANYAVIAEGDSNVPMVREREVLFIQRRARLEDGEVGLFTLNGCACIRQIRYTPDGAWLVAANPAYMPLYAGKGGDLIVHGAVVSPTLNTGLVHFSAEEYADLASESVQDAAYDAKENAGIRRIRKSSENVRAQNAENVGAQDAGKETEPSEAKGDENIGHDESGRDCGSHKNGAERA